jgi:hypothetical protein
MMMPSYGKDPNFDQHAQCIVVVNMTTLITVSQKTYFHAMVIITIPTDAISVIWFTVLWIIVGSPSRTHHRTFFLWRLHTHYDCAALLAPVNEVPSLVGG